MSQSALYKELKRYDGLTAERLHPNDRQRIQRALLVYHLSKKPLSTFHSTRQHSLPYSIVWIAICPESREQLKQNIRTRFKQMLSKGLVEEVEKLYRQPGFSSHLPAYRAVGYRQVIDYLKGDISFETLELKGATATCQLAKRQLTWLRTWPELATFYMSHPNLLRDIQTYIEEQLPNY